MRKARIWTSYGFSGPFGELPSGGRRVWHYHDGRFWADAFTFGRLVELVAELRR